MKPHARKDLILIAALLLAAALLYGAARFARRAPAACAVISVNGQIVARLDLDTDTDDTVPGYGGGYNRIIVRDGEIWVEEASCPDKICVRQGHIRESGQMIVCLPNRMVAEIREADE